ncbi:MAG: response regulator [Thermodesulfobacteriota bacterium]
MRITIRSRILFIFVGVTLIQALVIGAFFLYQQTNSKRKLVNQQLHTINDNISSQIATFCTTLLHDLETASQQVERMAQKDYQQYNLLKTLQNNNKAFAALAFYDINGVIRSSVFSNGDGVSQESFSQNSDLFDTPYLSETPFVTQFTAPDTTPLIGISQPIFFLDHSYIIGIISALVPISSFQEIIDQPTLPPMQNLLLLDSDGKILAKKVQGDADHSSFPADTDWDGNMVIDSVRHIAVSSTLDFYGKKFIVASTIESQKSLLPTTKSFFLLGYLILLLLFLAALVGWTTHKRIIRPLQLLADTSSTMIQGENVEMPLPGDAELNDLANALTIMNRQLKESNTSLKEEIKQRRLQEKYANVAKIDAEKANQAKSIFLANMSHEIRTPLHAMIGVLNMLDKESLAGEQKKLLSMASVSGQRLHSIVNSILDFSQIESGILELRQSPFSLSSLTDEVVELMQVHAADSNLTIKADIDGKIPDHLEGDSGRIRQILINLINNSIKFSRDGAILLTVGLQSPPTNDGLDILFSIRDSGTGISAESREKIFRAFEQDTMKAENIVEGTGLGLAISSEFAQHMGGKLWLESSDDSGSTFCFTIHCAVAVEEISVVDDEEEEEQGAEKKLSGLHILLAEDEFINQRIISAYIEEMGGEATVCENGQELLEKMEEKSGDIILMDIRMPILDGLEATKKIRKAEMESGKTPIPIIALTAQATTDFEEKCRQAGMDGYLTKPIPFDRLSELICELTGK